MLRRITPEVAASFAQRGQNRNAGGGPAGGAAAAQDNARANGGTDAPRREGRGGGGMNFQAWLQNLPPVSASDLKKGDLVQVTGSAGSDPSRVTAITLLTGDAEVMGRMLQRDRGPRRANTGLPGDTMGGGTGNREQP